MTSFLNQIFYNCNKFDTIDCIKLLENYMKIQPLYSTIGGAESPVEDAMLLETSEYFHVERDEMERDEIERDEIEPSTSVCVIEPMTCARSDPMVTAAVTTTPSEKQVYYPQKKNSLFWCIFISEYGYNEYYLIGNRFSNKELDVKQAMVHYFMQNTKHFKNSNYKVTNGLIQEISAELMINNKSSLLECIAFSIFFKRHVFIVKKNTFLMFTFQNLEGSEMTSENIVIVHYDHEKGEYGIDLEPTMNKVDSIRQEKVMLEHYDKPLKGVSNYKVYELEDIARKLQMKSTVLLNKTDLYKAVWDAMLW